MTTRTIPTETRVNEQTSEGINQSIRRQLEASVYFYAHHPEQIDERLRELEQEWDIERTLETHAGAVTVASVVLGLVIRPLRLFPLVVGGFLIQHAVQGWCPPVPVFRRLGFRTTYEINLERYALKTLRGDFQDVSYSEDPCSKSAQALDAVYGDETFYRRRMATE